MALQAIVLAGGRSRRMGSDKGGLRIDGQSLARRAVDACLAGGAERVALVAPDALAEAWLAGGARDERVLVTLEDPPDGGPSAGIAAGLSALAPADEDRVLLLACDLPATDRLVPALLELAAGGHAGVLESGRALVPVDDEGWPQYLAALYPAAALRDAVVGEVRDLSVRRLLRGLPAELVALPQPLLDDVDLPDQARAAGIDLP